LIDFQNDRHALSRVELAYRRVEMLATDKTTPPTSVQVTDAIPLTTDTLTPEIQG
jgi:hypothetical protein